MDCITYRAGYKYQLAREYVAPIEIRPDRPIQTQYVWLSPSGTLTIKAGYAWDGPSGPAIDTRNFMRGSLIHDALYQLMRGKYLDHDTYREAADSILRRICIEDGMTWLRAWWVYHGVRVGAGPSADPANDKPILWAPRGWPEGRAR